MTPEIILRSFSDDQYTLDKVFYSNFYRIKQFEAEQDSVVVDIGAHCGYFSMLCAMRGAMKIYNVEPFSENYKVLLKNSESFKEKAQNLKLGIYTEERLANLAYPKFENNFFYFSKANLNPEAELFDINPLITLDSLLKFIKEDEIDLLKINIGYAEIDILKTSNLITKCHYICGETTSNNEEMTAFTDVMRGKGFEDTFFAQSPKSEDQFIFLLAQNKCEKMFELSVEDVETFQEDEGP
jgi:FkbM family methyltransferase